MQVAVSVNGNGCLVAECKGYLGSSIGAQALSLSATVGLQINPRDVVLLTHGMRYRTNANAYEVIFNANNGNVLLMACFNNARLELCHLLATAHHGYAAIMD